MFNADRRPRQYLTPKEVELLRNAARERGRYGHRDATMILVAYRHGLRPAEVCALRWDQVDLAHGLVHVQRVKNGMPSVHPMGGAEMRDLRRLKREQTEGRHVFLTERRAPMTPAGFRKMIERVGEGWRFPVPGSPAHAAPRYLWLRADPEGLYAQSAAPSGAHHERRRRARRASVRPIKIT